MDFNRQLAESLAVVGQIAPTSQAAGASLSAAINTNVHRRLLAVVQVGAFGASATVDVKFTASATSGGTYADVTGAAITQMLAAGGNNKIVELEITAEKLASLGVGPFVKLSVTVGTAATLTSAVVYGSSDRYEPASDNNLAAVTQTVVVG